MIIIYASRYGLFLLLRNDVDTKNKSLHPKKILELYMISIKIENILIWGYFELIFSTDHIQNEVINNDITFCLRVWKWVYIHNIFQFQSEHSWIGIPEYQHQIEL